MIWIALAGGCGAVARYGTNALLTRKGASPHGWATWVINVLGSFLLGALIGWLSSLGGDTGLRLLLGAGFLGGYTTFSTACVETAQLLRSGNPGKALLLSASMLAASVLATAGGLALGAAG
ncbi:MAG: CrcB family protein [Propionibacteriaceae bacterium]|jgi:CrcB protein|nr:CrcB family protein [Propionibacteriaceae bacterium]